MALYAFDGTGDRWDPDTEITDTQKTKKDRYLTNVVMFYKYYRDSQLTAHYYPGVGSKRNAFDMFLGGAFGVGARGRVKSAFKQLKKNFLQGDTEIDIVGYSRGAAIARMFADMVFHNYQAIKGINNTPLGEPPIIRFVGLFDTVASFGNPFNDNELYFQDRIPPNVANTFHAMSLDVKSRGFSIDRAYGDNVLEVWFRGGHGDIGGNSKLENGLPNRKRTNISLLFMLKKAIACDIAIAQLPVLEIDATAPVSLDNNKDLDDSRRYRSHDIFHYSIFDSAVDVLKDGIGVDLPDKADAVIESVQNESEISEQRLIQLTPELMTKYPTTQAIYDKLYFEGN